MTLTQLIGYITKLDPDNMSDADALSLLNEAYKDAVKKIRLYPSIHPVVIDQSCVIGGFESPVIINTSLSQLCFKEIIAIHNCDIVTECTVDREENDAYSQDVMTIGTEFLGYTEAEYRAFNNNWNSKPSIFNIGKRFIVTNFDTPALVYVAGFLYPHPMKSVNGKYIDPHDYIIEEKTGYVMEDTLVPLMIMKARSIFYKKNNDTVNETMYDNIYATTLNIFRKNIMVKNVDSLQDLGLISSWTM